MKIFHSRIHSSIFIYTFFLTQDAKELLLSNQKNGDGSYLLRIGRDEKFVLSVKFRGEQGQWDVEHFRIKRTNKEENM